MADMNVEGPELKKLVKLCKKTPLAFAYAPGKKPADALVSIDRRKSAGFLAKALKKQSTGPKVAYGTCSVDGKLMTLTCEQTVATMAKSLKKYLKTQKVLVNIEVLDAAGNALESDIEDLPPDPDMDDDDTVQDSGVEATPQESAAPEPTPEPEQAETPAAPVSEVGEDAPDNETAAQRQRLTEQLTGLVGDVKSVAPAAAAKLVPALKIAKGLIESGDLDKAEATLGKIADAVAKTGAAPTEQASDDANDQTAAPDARALAARAGSLKQSIDAVGEPAKAKLLAALGAAVKLIKSGDLAGADAAMTKIETAANKVAASTGSDKGVGDDTETTNPNAAKWAAAEARLQPAVDKAMDDRRGDLDAINRAFNYAKELAADGAYDRALAAAAKVADLLKAAQSATTTAAAADALENVPADVVPYVKSRLSWISTRESMRAELETLKATIDEVTADVEGLEAVSSQSAKLFEYLDTIDGRLENTLEKLVETADGPDREALKKQAHDLIAEYQKELDSDFFKDVDNNGFTSTSIRATAKANLADMSKVLAA